ncbi:MAG: hypothetical protein KGZ54_06675 [Dethiobacter sp.]|jgi:hypothetical protein|nr:hypothetical protein [Dethiobacter sp.]MBS3901687.1 hypothetical protein [Dethiobacter sp.]MBS3988981.1 hypothetical protein [Dethiobacter sp.]
MENLIIFIIFIIFSALRSLAENKQKTGQRPGGRPGGLPVPPLPRPPRSPLQGGNLPPEYPQVVFTVQEARKERTAESGQLPVQKIIPETVTKYGTALNQEQLFHPQAATVLQGIVYAEVFGSPRARKRWKYR